MKPLQVLVSLTFAVLTLIFASYATFPWCDELVLADAPANWALHGVIEGRVWPCTYNFLYPALLGVWFKIFGVSHTTVCSLSVLAAFLTSIVCLNAASRRKLFNSRLSQIAFLCLFWGGWNFSSIITDGRLDALTLLFTSLFVDSLFPDANRVEGLNSVCRTALCAALLMLTSVYMLPVLFLLGVGLLAIGSTEERKLLVRKGLFAAAAFGLSYVFMLVWYFMLHETIRFAGFYLYFNTITGFKAEPMGIRICHAYLYNCEALALAALAAGLFVWRRCLLNDTGRNGARMTAFALVFMLAIPLLMTLGGRYEPYYSWTFYLSAVFAVTTAFASFRRSRVFLLMAVLCGVLSFVFRNTVRYDETEGSRRLALAGEEFVEEHRDIFTNGVEIVVAEGVEGGRAELFYPLLRSGARPWFRGYDTLSGPSDAEKFNVGLGMIISDPTKRSEILKRAMRYQKCMPTLPETGYVIFTSQDSLQKISPLIARHGRTLETISSTPFILARMR